MDLLRPNGAVDGLNRRYGQVMIGSGSSSGESVGCNFYDDISPAQ